VREVADSQQKADQTRRHVLKTPFSVTEDIRLEELQYDLSLSNETVVTIIQALGFHKVCAQWLPRALPYDRKAQGMTCAVSFLQQCAATDYEFLDRIASGDETQVIRIQRLNMQAWSGNNLRLRDYRTSRLSSLLASGSNNHCRCILYELER
jgi:hypothetical protein